MLTRARVSDADCMRARTPIRRQAKPHFEGKDLPADGIGCQLTNGDFGTSPLYGATLNKSPLAKYRWGTSADSTIGPEKDKRGGIQLH